MGAAGEWSHLGGWGGGNLGITRQLVLAGAGGRVAMALVVGLKASSDSVSALSDVWGANGTAVFLSLINQICGPPGYQHNGNIGLEPLSCNSITHCK